MPAPLKKQFTIIKKSNVKPELCFPNDYMIKHQKNKFKIMMLVVLAVVTIITYINPVFPQEQFLQQAGTILLFSLMLTDLRKH